MIFKDLRKNLKRDFSGFKKIKLALLGDSSTQLLAQAIRGSGYNISLDIEIFDADYNQIEPLVMNTCSELYVNNSDYIVIFEAGHKLLQKYNMLNSSEREVFAEDQFERISKLATVLKSSSKAHIFWANYAEEDDMVFGNYANKVNASFVFQQRKLNYLLSEFSRSHNSFSILDISGIQNKFGRDFLFSPSIYVNAESVLSIDVIPAVSDSVVQMVAVNEGNIKKCLILDLDNTIWGGIIGDDGLNNIQIGSLGIGKAFTEFQYLVKKLQQRGIILCVCSKNTESVAQEPFNEHPDMVLRLDDFAVFKANWNSKVENIISIQQTLNIGFDSMVFLDDNPFERDIVRDSIKGITVPELPKDPAEYLTYLYSLNLFETASYSSEDTNRTAHYHIKSKIETERLNFSNAGDFLKSINMVSDVQNFNSYSIPRVAQLSQRSNQFNLRTVRYTDDDLKRISESNNHITFSFTLEDKHGDHGIICAVILECKNDCELFIDTWFMSCRVLKRSMEGFVLNSIVKHASKREYKKLLGEYIPSSKNAIVKDHYSDLGFKKNAQFWELDICNYKENDCYINMKEI